jgi:hypothetical protein
MTPPRLARSLAPLGLLLVAALALGACGGSSSDEPSGTAASSPTPGARRAFASGLTAEQRSCLQKHGVTFPQGRGGQPPQGGGYGYGGGRFRGGAGRRPGGRAPDLTDAQRKQLEARRQEMQAAFKACGIQVPQRPAGGPRPAAPSATPTTTNQ